MKKQEQNSLKRLEEEIVELIKKRASYYCDYLKKRRKKKLPVSDRELEARLWKVWRDGTKDTKIDQKLLRNIYNQINTLSYKLSEREEERVFKLKKKFKKNVKIDIAGPLDVYLTKFLICLSGIKNIPIELKNIVINDSVYELIKVLNGLDANLSWEKDRLSNKLSNPINFNKRAVFVGQDELNLYLLIFAAISQGGICKFTGDSELKLMDLRPIFPLLPQMGARIAPLIPGSYGLPIRLEATGTIDDNIVVLDEVPDTALCSLILSTVLYPLEKITICCSAKRLLSPIIQRILYLFEQNEINYHKENNRITIFPRSLTKLNIEPILDPELTSYLLAIPIIKGGTARVEGILKIDFTDVSLYLDLLTSNHTEISLAPFEITLTSSGRKEKFFSYDLKGQSNLLPLSLAMTLFHKRGEILNIPRSENEDLTYILQQMEIDFNLRENTLTILECMPKNKTIKITAPNPRWMIFLSLASLMGFEILLENPGEITKLWPSYWTYFKSLPIISNADEKSKEEEDVPKKTRRRIFAPGDKKTG